MSKTDFVNSIFSSVATKYDLMNDLMSFGLHRYWKKRFISHLNPSLRDLVLDVAGGTGDISYRIRKKFGGINIIISDINPEMLNCGRDKLIDQGLFQDISWMCNSAEELPVEDNSINLYTISFGIRNVSSIEKSLAEAYRVLSPGGKFACMEFSRVDNEVLAKIYDLYSFNVIPKLGKVVTGNEEAYEYLVDSIRKFPHPNTFKLMISDAGFKDIKISSLTAGVVSIYTAIK